MCRKKRGVEREGFVELDGHINDTDFSDEVKRLFNQMVASPEPHQ
jgi:hypothetical protein